MGMAASQARYLALTARKTNTEWEGQQINQARTALANQSANLFNRLLGLEVPNPPKTTDYTTLQYSFTDGENEEVIESWEKLANDNNYNYSVNHYYFADIYTGSKKLLQDPQVQMKQVLNEFEYDSKDVTWAYDAAGNMQSITTKYNQGNVSEERTFNKITPDEVVQDTKLETSLRNFETAKNMIKSDGALSLDNVYGYYETSDGTWHFMTSKEVPYTGTVNQGGIAFEYVDGKVVSATTNEGGTNYTYSHIDNNQVLLNQGLRDALDANHMLDEDGKLIADNIFGRTDENGNWIFTTPEVDVTKNEEVPAENKEYISAYSPAYIGNSPIKELTQLSATKELDQVSELAQILRDCKDSSMSQYLSFDDDGNLVYDGKGIYTFELYGKTYYTTEKDLQNSVGHPYDPTKPIELQSKLAYYNASYVQNKIESKNKALLETDSNGRFKSVRFDNDSVTYSLNVETVTNEQAYNDAMNQYLYKKSVYEKTIEDINRKTEIIQQEDRTLELRLKQLDTEQNALSVEMDAVKKVIKDNVDKTFKTFSD